MDTQLKTENLEHKFPHLKLQCESDDIDSKIELIKYIEKHELLQYTFGSRFSDFNKEEGNKILIFISPFSVNEETIKYLPSNMQM